MLTRTVLSRALLLAFSGTAALSGPSAFAQQAPASTPQELQRVTVTGSNIKRTDAETSSPVQVISKQEIDQSGKGTVAEYLQTLTADGQGSVPFTYGRGFSGATASGISLRGLGANATLVLLNGRRVASTVLADDASRSYVDLNSIPLEAVDRIEVLKDGASAVYGSDAVAGVVNIILKKNFVGTVAKISYGVAEEGDGNEPRVAITHGFGNLDKDGFNVLLNAEFGKKDPIYYRDRAGRNSVGVSANGQGGWGFDPNSTGANPNNIARGGGNGWIPVTGTGAPGNNLTTPSIIGNVQGTPGSGPYYSRGSATAPFNQFFPAAQTFCDANANLPQNNTAGGCLIDARQAINQIQPKHETANLFGRFTKTLNNNWEAFFEAGFYQSKSRVDGLPIAPSAAYFPSTGIAVSQTAASALGANHPDNPFQGSVARLSYLPLYDTGITGTDSKSQSYRVLGGARGSYAGFDIDAAVYYSRVEQKDTATNVVNWRVKNALLNPTPANVAAATAFSPAYAALPAGTYWRIGENANLNSQAMYDALLANKSREGESSQYGADVKVSRELGQLPGGALGVAFGIEARHEANDLPFWDGQGNYQGLSLTTYGGKRDVYATYAEIVAPITKQIELNGAIRYDHYSDAGNSVTPKVGIKFRPTDNLALRGSYAMGFRAPSFAENSNDSLAAYGGATVIDTVRCDAGVLTSCGSANAIGPTFVIRGNPDLEPEKARAYSLGLVWDVTPKSSLTFDIWQIKRKGLIYHEEEQAAVSANEVIRDPSTSTQAGDPGAILSGFLLYKNLRESVTRGFDIEAKTRFDFSGSGRLNLGLTYSRLMAQRTVYQDGSSTEFAGTHGDCNITNCIGSPKNKLSAAATWDAGLWRLGANVNYRGSMSNRDGEGTDCLSTLANGDDYPSGCKLKSFTTVDLSGSVMVGKNLEVFGSVANVFDSKPPSDFYTYGAIGYNALDYSGAIGRFFRLGLKYKF